MTVALAVDAEANKKLNILTKSFERVLKELSYYKDDIAKQQLAISQLDMTATDPFVKRQLEEALQETHQVLPVCKQQIEKYHQEISLFIQLNADSPVSKSQEWQKALELLSSYEKIKPCE